jgi:hypothetical protein
MSEHAERSQLSSARKTEAAGPGEVVDFKIRGGSLLTYLTYVPFKSRLEPLQNLVMKQNVAFMFFQAPQ